MGLSNLKCACCGDLTPIEQIYLEHGCICPKCHKLYKLFMRLIRLIIKMIRKHDKSL